MTAGFIDLHSHVVPGVDDGAATLDESLASLQCLYDLGFRTVCATPHQKAGTFETPLDEIERRTGELKTAVSRALPALQILRGAENSLDDLFHARMTPFAIPCYETGRAFLVELRAGVIPPHLEDLLYGLRTRGHLPVLAHPERYGDLLKDDERLARVARVAALVVDLSALGETFGSGPARQLVLSGYAHAVASDIHDAHERSMLARGIAWMEKKLGSAGVDRLLRENPQRILAGELPT